MMRRKQKIIRNLLACLLLALCTYVLLDFPAYSLGAMCRKVEREYLLPELVPLYVLKEKNHYHSDWFERTFTFVVARAGKDYISFQYDRSLMQNWRYYTREADLAKGALCTARAGTLYVAGDFPEAASAEIAVTAEDQNSETPERRVFTMEGEPLGECVFGFYYGDVDTSWANRHPRPKTLPEDAVLADALNVWYWKPADGSGYTLLHAELPCTVTLYDAAGEVLETLDLSVESYDLNSWY